MAERSDSDLKQASIDLYYEYEMLRETARYLAGGGSDSRILRNALVESFVVHARNLIAFLGWYGKVYQDDVLAKDYVSDFESSAPDKTWVSSVHKNACTRVQHLSYKRAEVKLDDRNQPVREIVEGELERLVRLTPDHLLDDVWKAPRVPVFIGSPVVALPAGASTTTSEVLSTTISEVYSLNLSGGKQTDRPTRGPAPTRDCVVPSLSTFAARGR